MRRRRLPPSGASLVGMLRAARSAGKAALDNTPELLPVLKDAGVVDAGGAGYLLFLDSALFVVDGDAVAGAGRGRRAQRRRSSSWSSHRHATRWRPRRQRAALRGDVLPRSRRRAHRGRSSSRGARSATRSSSSAATGCGTATCTPTTSAPRSRPRSISTAARSRSASPTCSRRSPRSTPYARPRCRVTPRREPAPGSACPPVTCAVVAVASGDGLAELFGQLGVQGVVTGGQTLNPSTAELLDAVERSTPIRSWSCPTTRTSSPSPSSSTR